MPSCSPRVSMKVTKVELAYQALELLVHADAVHPLAGFWGTRR